MDHQDSINRMWSVKPACLSYIETLLSGPGRFQARGLVLPQPAQMTIQNGVAIIHIEGVLTKHPSIFSSLFSATPMELTSKELRAALGNPKVKSIVLKIDSPGGTVDGTQELASLIFQARGKKPIITFSDGQLVSAALWIGAASEKMILSSQTVEVGSVGVVATHTDVSRLEEAQGLKITEIVSGLFKRALSSHRPLSESGQQVLQASVDEVHKIFVADLAKFRGVTAEAMQAKVGDGRTFIGQQALAVGLADAIMPFEELLASLKRGGYPKKYQHKKTLFPRCAWKQYQRNL